MFVPHVCYGHTRVTRVQTSRDPTADCRLNWPLIRYLQCTAGSKRSQHAHTLLQATPIKSSHFGGRSREIQLDNTIYNNRRIPVKDVSDCPKLYHKLRRENEIINKRC